MDEAPPDRRRFLTYAGAGVAVAIGGCLGESGAATTPTNASTGTPSTPTDAETRTATESETTTTHQTPEPTMSTVFHFSGVASEQNHAVANVSNLLADDSVDLGNVALVANGRGIELLDEDASTAADEVRRLIDEGVQFYVCRNSMQALGVTEDDLLDPNIEVVPAGVGALTTLQAKEGYAYIKTP